MSDAHLITLLSSAAENLRMGYVRFEVQLYLIYCQRVDFQYFIYRVCKLFEYRSQYPEMDRVLFALAHFNQLRNDKHTLLNEALITDMRDTLHKEGLCSCPK